MVLCATAILSGFNNKCGYVGIKIRHFKVELISNVVNYSAMRIS